MQVSGRIVLGDLVLNTDDRGARYNEQVVHLTPREFAILWLLASRPGKVFERRELLEKAWGPSEFVEPRTVDAHVVKVRRKLQASGVAGLQIETIWRVGYRLQVDARGEVMATMDQEEN